MDSIRILNADEVRSLVSMPMALGAVEQAYVEKSEGTGQVWPLIFHEFVDATRDMDLKSGNLDGAGIWGLKAISCYKDNPDQGLPIYHFASLVFDYKTGAPRAVLNAGPITRFRTGAAGAVGAKHLARKDSRTLLVCGTGALAPYAIAAILLAMPQLERVLVANPRTPSKAAERACAIEKDVRFLLGEAGAALSEPPLVEATEDLEAATRLADVIVTATPSEAPYIKAEWVRPGTHVSCLGADKPGKQEVDEQLLGAARVVVDDEAQCFAVGECERAHAVGILGPGLDQIGDVIAGKVPGRTSDEEITVFDSTGLALQDLATIARICDRADASGVGTVVNL